MIWTCSRSMGSEAISKAESMEGSETDVSEARSRVLDELRAGLISLTLPVSVPAVTVPGAGVA